MHDTLAQEAELLALDPLFAQHTADGALNAGVDVAAVSVGVGVRLGSVACFAEDPYRPLSHRVLRRKQLKPRLGPTGYPLSW